MKKLLAILLAGLMMLALVGCSNGTAEDELITADSSVTSASDVTDEALPASETDVESEVTEEITSEVEEIEKTPEVTTTVATTEATTVAATVTTEATTIAFTVEDVNLTMYAKSQVNVRSGPSTDFDRIGHLDEGEEVTVTGIASTGWYRISFKGDVGYVSNNYLTETAKEKVTEAVTTTAVTTIATTTEAEEAVNIWADIDGEDVPGSEINNGRAGLTLVEGSVTSTGATFILHNYVTYVAGVDGYLELDEYTRWLQVYENGEWRDVINDYEEEVIIAGEALCVEEDDEYQFTVNWGSTYGELPAGHYRYLMRGEYYKEDSFFVACGFDIE